MRLRLVFVAACVVVVAALLALIPVAAQEPGPRFSAWGPATPLGEPFTKVGVQQVAPFISKDNLDLYFAAADDARLVYDIYVSHRESPDSPWQTPVNVGPEIDTPWSMEAIPFVTIDGHWLYFVSDRPGGYGGADIWVSHRKDKRDPQGWETPVNLGRNVNTELDDHSPSIFEDEAAGKTMLYFSTGYMTATASAYNIFQAELLDRDLPAPATEVTELSGTGNDSMLPFVRRKDGLEVFFSRWIPRTGIFIFSSTRPSTSSPWSAPVNLGMNVNALKSWAMKPALSWDGTTLYFWSNRTGAGRLYMSMRTQLKGKGQ